MHEEGKRDIRKIIVLYMYCIFAFGTDEELTAIDCTLTYVGIVGAGMRLFLT